MAVDILDQFDRDFPDGAWKEVLKSGALGVPMDTAKLEQYSQGWAQASQTIDADIGKIVTFSKFFRS